MPVTRARRWIHALWIVAALTASAGIDRASAQTCTLNVTALAFGAVDVTANAQVDSTATASISCTGLSLGLVGVCIEIGVGSGGASAADSRFLANGASQLRFGLFSDGGVASPWGSGAWPGGGGSPVGVNIPLSLGGAGATSKTIYGRIFSGQPSAAPVVYASSFTGADMRIRYGLLSFLLGCDLLTKTATATLNVTASVPTTCRLTANTLDFGTVGVLSSIHDASTSLTPTCTLGTAYQVGLDGGLSAAANPEQRRMTKGAETILYGLYRNAGRTQPFGALAGVDTLAGIGTGLPLASTVYGRVASQPTPTPGLFTDTIVATITY